MAASLLKIPKVRNLNGSLILRFFILLSVIGGVVWASVPSLWNCAVPANQILIEPDPLNLMNRRAFYSEDVQTIAQKSGLLGQGRYRYQLTVDRSDIPKNHPALLFADAGGRTYMLVNGSLVRGSAPLRVDAPGMGATWRAVELKENVLLPGENRIEFVVEQAPLQTGLKTVYISSWPNISKVAVAFAAWQKWFPRLVLMASALGLVVSLYGLLLLGRRPNFYAFWGLVASLLMVQVTPSVIGYLGFGEAVWSVLRFLLPGVTIGVLVLQLLASRSSEEMSLQDRMSGFWFTIVLASGALLLINVFVSVGFLKGPMLVTAYWGLLASFILVEVYIAAWTDFMARRSRMEELTQKVQEQAVELDAKSRRVAYEMRNRAILEERQRFTRDIHDGIGGQLLSLLLRIRTGALDNKKIAEEIQASLNDLRLVVDSIDHVGDDLSAALTTFRVRAEPQMKAAGIAFNWHQSDTLNGGLLKAGATLHLYRMVQEVLSNIVRHAQATQVDVTISQQDDDGMLVLEITDNGIGLPAEKIEVSGKGIKNLFSRARSLSADVAFKQGPNDVGTTVLLSVPVSAKS